MSWNDWTKCCLLAAALACMPAAAIAQESPPHAPRDSAGHLPVPNDSAGYPRPAIRMMEPSPGGTVLIDRPFVRFQFQPGAPGDAIDPASFRLEVNGEDRSRGFSVSPAAASGSIAGGAAPGSPPITPGVHLIEAMVCTVRRACSSITAAVVVSSSPTAPMPTMPSGAGQPGPPPPAAGIPTSAGSAPAPSADKSRRRKLAEAVHAALGKLIAP
jgi:hypothetical protein